MSDAQSARGRLVPPDLDDRRWQDLVDEARALIPRYAPQWTDHNPSDIGMTLVELFAWLVEGLIYRLNRVPDKNHIAFLRLLGITRLPPLPATTLLTFSGLPGSTADVPRGTQAQTAPTETAAPLVFETDSDLRVTALTARAALLVEQPADAPERRYRNVSAMLGQPADQGPALTVAPGGSAQLCLGVTDPAAAELDLYVEVGRWQPAEAEAAVTWVASAPGVDDPAEWPPAEVHRDLTAGLHRPGLVRLTAAAPPSRWAAQTPADWPVQPAAGSEAVTDSLQWVGLRIANPAAQPLHIALAHLLVNTVPASSTRTVSAGIPEQLGRSDGSPLQVFELAHRPVHRLRGTDRPFAHVVVTVDGEAWTLVDDLQAGPHRQHRLDAVAGEIIFGNHEPSTQLGHGAVPAAGARIEASYRYVAHGAAGNVPAGAISALATPVADVVAVRNPVPATGGADEEPIEATARRAPELLRTRNRAVTAADYEHLVREHASGIGVVRCLPPRLHEDDNGAAWRRGDPWRFAGLLRAPGMVNVLLAPDLGADVDRPQPSPALIHEVRRVLDRRGELTAHLHVSGPRYLPIRMTVDARIFRRAVDEGRIDSAAAAYADIERRVRRFLHPLAGGPDERGWIVGQDVFLADAYQAVRPPEDIGYIASLQLEALVPPYHDPPLGPGGTWSPDERPLQLAAPGPLVRVADYELVCFGDTRIPPQPLE